MAFKEGDFVLVEYILKVKESGEVVDTTDENEARKHGIYSERDRYGPRLVIIGEGRIISGLEEALKNAEVGKEITVTIPPERAFGRRDPQKIKIIPLSQFRRSGVVPEPGKVVEINGQLAIIRNVTGGRVIVDFNHPLAGKTMEATIRVIKQLDNVEEKVLHLLLRRLPPAITENDVKVEYEPTEKHVKVRFNEKALAIQDMQVVKRIVVSEIAKFMRPEIDKIDFTEHIEFTNKKGEPGSKQSETEQAETQPNSVDQAKPA